MEKILSWLSQYWFAALISCSCLIEIVPIKINPISSLLKWVGEKTNETSNKKIIEIGTRLTNVEAAQKALNQTVDQNEIDRIRYEVLEFANSCRNGKRHTRDGFLHIIALTDKYEKLLKKYDLANGVFEAEYKYILSLYQTCQLNNDFL